MINDVLNGEDCRWCGRSLAKSFLTRLTLGIEKSDAVVFPILCLCGGITVIGAGTCTSHVEDLIDPNDTSISSREPTEEATSPRETSSPRRAIVEFPNGLENLPTILPMGGSDELDSAILRRIQKAFGATG